MKKPSPELLGRFRLAGHRHRPDRCGTDDDDPPDVLGLHRGDDRAGAARGDARIRPRVARAERGQHGVGSADGRGKIRHVGLGEVDGDCPDACRQVVRAAGHGGHLMPAGHRLVDQVFSDAAGGGHDGELHRCSSRVKAALCSAAQLA